MYRIVVLIQYRHYRVLLSVYIQLYNSNYSICRLTLTVTNRFTFTAIQSSPETRTGHVVSHIYTCSQTHANPTIIKIMIVTMMRVVALRVASTCIWKDT